MSVAPHFLSMARSVGPQMMTNPAGTAQFGVYVTQAAGAFAFRRDLAANSMVTFDLTTIAGNPLGLPLLDPTDDHYVLACGVDATTFWVAGNQHGEVGGQQKAVRCVSLSGPGFTTASNWAGIGTAPFESISPNAGYTYSIFRRRSDGTLIWFFSQDPQVGGARGRDWVAAKYVSGSWVKLAAAGTGHLVETAWDGVASGVNQDGSPVRVYIPAVEVTSQGGGDRIHVFGIWRYSETTGADSQQDAFYICSDDGGATWKTITGTAMTVPITWYNYSAARVTAQPSVSWLNTAVIGIDPSGYPHWACANGTQAGYTGWNELWWDGTAWHNDVLQANFFIPAVIYHRGVKWKRVVSTGPNGGTSGGTQVTLQTAGKPTVRVGGIVGPNSVPQPDPTRLWEQGIMSFLIGEGDTPKVFEFGNTRVSGQIAP